MTHNSAIDDILTRGVVNIIPNEVELKKLLSSDKKLNVYLGIDPTATHIHLGHTIPLRKIQKLSELGHNVTFLIGNFTALVGDTSDKESERPILTPEEIEHNFQTYKQQASKFLDFTKIQLKYNGEWLSKLTFAEIIKICYHFSAGDFVSRELIKKRLLDGKKVGLHELLYPVMQGYDSYYMDTDLQIGAADQIFNMQAGRALQKDLRNKQSFVLETAYLTGTDGRKMSKTWGNAIWLDDPAEQVYGKVMSLKDELILEYFTLATNLSLEKISEITNFPLERDPSASLKRGVLPNPMETKKRLAWQITKELHDETAANTAQAEFERIYQQGSTPTDIPEFKTDKTEWNPIDLLTETKLADSKSSARRLIEQGGLKIDNKKIEDLNQSVIIKSGTTIQAGKHKFIKIKGGE